MLNLQTIRKNKTFEICNDQKLKQKKNFLKICKLRLINKNK